MPDVDANYHKMAAHLQPSDAGFTNHTMRSQGCREQPSVVVFGRKKHHATAAGPKKGSYPERSLVRHWAPSLEVHLVVVETLNSADVDVRAIEHAFRLLHERLVPHHRSLRSRQRHRRRSREVSSSAVGLVHAVTLVHREPPVATLPQC